MMQPIVQHLDPKALYLPDLTKKWLPKNLAKAHLGLLKRTSFIIHDPEGLARLALLLGIMHTTGARRTDSEETCRELTRNGQLIGRKSIMLK